MFLPTPLHHALNQLRHTGERRLLLLTGEPAWGLATANQLLPADALWLGEGAPPEQTRVLGRADKLLQCLGQEFDMVVMNGFSGLHPDRLGAAGGTVRAGGLLLLLMPPLADWAEFRDPDHERYVALPEQAAQCHDHFLQRLQRELLADPQLWHLDQRQGLLRLPPVVAGAAPWHPPVDDWLCVTPDQRQAVEAILHCARGHRSRPLVLSADRGRGKSAALGLAAGRLLRSGQSRRILLTAPSQSTVQTTLRWADQHPGLHFFSPDRLLQERPPGDLLLVDEAAAIPSALLIALLKHYHRIVFATTLHGYEGSGRGFALRMRQILDRKTPGWQALQLSTPIRWRHTDPLEPLLARLLLLDAEVNTPEQLAAEPAFQILTQPQLLGDEALLRQLFGLLVLAHYQTSPSDLRTLLDSPQLEILALRQGEQLLAVALLCREGELPPDLAEAIWAGRRRPRGQLLPQSLLAHAGYQDAGLYRYARIMRIAVHPRWQRRGLGGRLVSHLEQYCRRQQLDFLGCAFAASADLLGFWRQQGLLPVRLGLSQDVASGAHSALMLKALQPARQARLTAWQQRFQAQLPDWLAQPLAELPVAVLCALLDPACAGAPLCVEDETDLQAFAWHLRHIDHCLPALKRWLQAHTAALLALPEPERSLLVRRVWQGHAWSRLATELGLPGQKAMQQRLRLALAASGTLPVPERRP